MFQALLDLVVDESINHCTAGVTFKSLQESSQKEITENKTLRLELFSEIIHATSKMSNDQVRIVLHEQSSFIE